MKLAVAAVSTRARLSPMFNDTQIRGDVGVPIVSSTKICPLGGGRSCWGLRLAGGGPRLVSAGPFPCRRPWLLGQSLFS